MKKKVIVNQIPEVKPKQLVTKGISGKSEGGRSHIGNKKVVQKKNKQVTENAMKAEVKQSKPKVKNLIEKVVVPIAEAMDKIKVLTFSILKRNADGTVKKANMEIFIPLTTKYNVSDKGKVEKRDYLRAIYEFDSANEMKDNVLGVNNYNELLKSQFNALHVAVGKLVKEKIADEKEKAVIKAKEGLKQLRKEENKKSGKKKISNTVPPKGKKK